MENLISTTYNIVGMSSGASTTKAENILDAVAGVISVKIDAAAGEVHITSNKIIKMDSLEHALVDTDYYITRQTKNSWVAAPSFRKVANRIREGNVSKNIGGSSSGGSASTGPVTDYDRD